MILAVCVCWCLSALFGSVPSTGFTPAESANPLGLGRSVYGSLVARLMKDSMHNYWHAGCQEHGHGHVVIPTSESIPAHTHEKDMVHHPEHSAVPGESDERGGESLLERAIDRLAELEDARKTPTAGMKISKAHRRYLDASANWQLRLAYHLDPGDATLYEIMHYTVTSRAGTQGEARNAAIALAKETLDFALSEQGSMVAALTGAGAAINLLNADMVRGASVEVSEEEKREHWEMLGRCLSRYQRLRQEAVSEGWWESVPQVRRAEVAAYAALVEKLAGTIGRKLAMSAN